jgi:hypothetical protein
MESRAVTEPTGSFDCVKPIIVGGNNPVLDSQGLQLLFTNVLLDILRSKVQSSSKFPFFVFLLTYGFSTGIFGTQGPSLTDRQIFLRVWRCVEGEENDE